MSEEVPRYGVTAICENPEDRGMTLNEYQQRAMTTCMDSCDNHAYMLTGLVGEVGELFGKIAKHIRKEKMLFHYNELYDLGLTEQEIHDLKSEVGDCVWFIAGFCKVMGWSLEEVAQENLAKLADRKERGVIDSDGDNR